MGLGIGVLILALSISSAFTRLLAQQLAGEGLVVMVVMVANARSDVAPAPGTSPSVSLTAGPRADLHPPPEGPVTTLPGWVPAPRR